MNENIWYDDTLSKKNIWYDHQKTKGVSTLREATSEKSYMIQKKTIDLTNGLLSDMVLVRGMSLEMVKFEKTDG